MLGRRVSVFGVSTNVKSSLPLDVTLAADLAILRERGLGRDLRVIHARNGAVVATDRGAAVDFSSNDYLGLATDARLLAAAMQAAAIGNGSTASRLIAGNTAEHEALDAALAKFFGVEAALSFSCGYAANTGV